MSLNITGLTVRPSYAESKCYLTWNKHVYSVDVQKSRNGFSGWEKIGVVEPSAESSFVDENYMVRNRVQNYFYRLVDPLGTTSDVVNANTLTDHTQNGIVNFILTEEIIHMRSGSGIRVAILSKNTDTARCPECVDVDTGQILNTRCKVCGGTGRVGAYAQPIQTYAIRMNPTQEDTQTGQSPNQNVQRVYQFRTVNIPAIKEQDVIVDKVSDNRYIVNALESYDFRGILPIIVTLKTTLLPRDNPVYAVVC